MPVSSRDVRNRFESLSLKVFIRPPLAPRPFASFASFLCARREGREGKQEDEHRSPLIITQLASKRLGLVIISED